MTDLLKNYQRLYTPGGRVAHLIWGPDWTRESSYPHAVCGWWGQHTYWLGTGSQDEYERADELPLCQKCKRFVDR